MQFVSNPVVQPLRATNASAGRASRQTRHQASNQASQQANHQASNQGSHVVQLGAFASAEGAQRAWRHFAARHAGLSGYHSQFSEVTVNGRKFYRVQASGFAAAGAARQMCQSVKAKGGVCLVMADPRGVTPQGRTAPTRMAQR